MFGFLNVDDGFRPPNLEKHFNEALEPRFKVLNDLFYKTGLVVGLRRFVRPEIKEAVERLFLKHRGSNALQNSPRTRDRPWSAYSNPTSTGWRRCCRAISRIGFGSDLEHSTDSEG